MNVQFTGRNIDLPDNFKDYAEEKINSLEKFLGPDKPTLFAEVEIIRNTHHLTGGALSCQINVWVEGKALRAEDNGDDFMEVFDRAFDKLKRQADEHHQQDHDPRNS